jgi:hypothetical protein
MEKSLSEKESLDLINTMISSARNNLQKGIGNIYLLWGYVIAVLAYRFRPLMTGAVICWSGTVFIAFFYHSDFVMEIQLACLTISIIAGYIIPGHLLKLKEKQDVS